MEPLIKINFLLQLFLLQKMSFDPCYVFLIPSMSTKIYMGVEPVVAHLESLAVAFARGNSGGSTSTWTSNEMDNQHIRNGRLQEVW